VRRPLRKTAHPTIDRAAPWRALSDRFEVCRGGWRGLTVQWAVRDFRPQLAGRFLDAIRTAPGRLRDGCGSGEAHSLVRPPNDKQARQGIKARLSAVQQGKPVGGTTAGFVL
jgi:hypothetical protein